ncbi:hypothetical protein D3C75_1187080 [compost metagenome]
MLKKIRSPGFRSPLATLTPWPWAMALEVRGRSTSATSLKAYLTSPLQSKPFFGLLPPQTYGVPSTFTARLSTSLLCFGDMAATGTPRPLAVLCGRACSAVCLTGACFTEALLV